MWGRPKLSCFFFFMIPRILFTRTRVVSFSFFPLRGWLLWSVGLLVLCRKSYYFFSVATKVTAQGHETRTTIKPARSLLIKNNLQISFWFCPQEIKKIKKAWVIKEITGVLVDGNPDVILVLPLFLIPLTFVLWLSLKESHTFLLMVTWTSFSPVF